MEVNGELTLPEGEKEYLFFSVWLEPLKYGFSCSRWTLPVVVQRQVGYSIL
jgi:hypothetical protein